MWEDNAHKGQNWCKNGKANGSYVQQIEYENCQDGWVWEPGQAAIAAIGQGYVTVDAAAAHQRLHRARQRRHAVRAAARRGPGLPVGQGGAADQPAGDQAPAGRVGDPLLHPLRAGRRGDPGTAAGAFGGFPLNQVCVAGKTGTAQIMGKNATSVFASFAPCTQPQARGRRHAAELRLRRGRRGAGGPADLGRHLRPGGQEGGPAGRHLPALPELTATPGERGRRVSVGLPSRGWAGPRAGTFAPAAGRPSPGRSPRAAWPGPGTGC